MRVYKREEKEGGTQEREGRKRGRGSRECDREKKREREKERENGLTIALLMHNAVTKS